MIESVDSFAVFVARYESTMKGVYLIPPQFSSCTSLHTKSSMHAAGHQVRFPTMHPYD